MARALIPNGSRNTLRMTETALRSAPWSRAWRSALPEDPHIWQFGARAARARTAEMRRPKARAGVWLATGGGAPAAVRANSFPPPAAAAVGGRSPLVGTGAEKPRCCHVAPLRGRSQHTLWACRRGEALRAHIICPCSDLARRARRGRAWRALCRAGARSEGREAHCCPTGGIGARPRGARGVRGPNRVPLGRAC